MPLALSASIVDWCRQWLGDSPTRLLFQVRHISTVTGLQLAGGQKVVLKVRPRALRLQACVLVQHRLWQAGFPCPKPLAGPAPLDGMAATAEHFVGGGTRLARTGDAPRRYALALARLVTLAPAPASLPTLLPPPYWLRWEHPGSATWPQDPDVDLNAQQAPAWLEQAAARVRRRLLPSAALPGVVGHGDWESQNLRWVEGRLHVAHDWDSVVVLPEATIAGAAAIVFPASGTLNEQATLAESLAFLEAYAQARSRPWTSEEWQLCWAAGFWVQAYKAKKALLTGGGRRLVDLLEAEAGERLRRAGV